MIERADATHQAIIDFIGRFEIPKQCNCLSDLFDGVVLWSLMQRIDGLVQEPSAFNPEPCSLASVLANLKLIMQCLENFYKRMKRPWQREAVDLIEIAHHKNQEQTTKLFLMVLAAAIESDSKQTFIEMIRTLPQESQVVFVAVIKRALGEVRANDELNGGSPKTEQSAEKRLLEKLEELEMQNQKLHSVVKELHEERGLLTTKLTAAMDTIASEQRENERLVEMVRENCMANDLKLKEVEKEKTDAYINNLKNKLIDVTRAHEKQLSQLREELELERSGISKLHILEEQLEHYQEKYEECKQILLKYEQVENERSRLSRQSQEKEDMVKKLKERISELTQKVYELEERQLEGRMELEKKNTRVEELHREIDNIKSRRESISHHELPIKSAKSLSELCPEINNHDVAHLKDHNQTLLADLEKSTKKIRTLERDLDRYKREAERAHGLETENKKLEEILLEYNQTRGEENELLVGCLYEMRMKYREAIEHSRKDARMSLPMRGQNKQLPKKMLS